MKAYNARHFGHFAGIKLVFIFFASNCYFLGVVARISRQHENTKKNKNR
jgi:hypothetical protein